MHIPPNNSRTPENLTPESGVGVGVDFFSGVGLGSGLPQMLNFYVSKVKLIVGPHLHLVHQVKSIFALSLSFCFLSARVAWPRTRRMGCLHLPKTETDICIDKTIKCSSYQDLS
jgi:hypothetical protein